LDWTKAKTILIIALLVSNVTIIVTYIFDLQSKENVDENLIREILEDANVIIETELPDYPKRMAVLYVQPEHEDRKAVMKVLEAQTRADISLSSESEIDANIEAANRIMKECGYLTKNTELSLPTYEKNGETLIKYRNVYDNIPIEESSIICAVKGGRVLSLEREWYSPVELHDKRGEIMGALEAMIMLLPDKDESETLIIKGVELVYWVNSEGAGVESPVADTALPAWKITDSMGNDRYVTAYRQR
jgi:regulatory protein YycI of two-component signal transduction system YycFG